MRKVSNGKIITKLSKRSLMSNRSRNIVAICAIMLTTILFTTLFTLGIGSIESFQRASIRQSGGDGHAVLKYITDEEFQKVKGHKSIKEIAYCRILADEVKNEEFLKRHTEFWYMDDVGLRLGFSEPTHGHKPQRENEIITDTMTLKLLGVKEKVGEPVTLSLLIRGNEVKREFVLAGWWESDPIFNVGMIVSSRAYVDAHLGELKNTYKNDSSITGTVNAYVKFHNSLNLERKLNKLLIDKGYSPDPDAPNYMHCNVHWAYLSTNFGLDAPTIIVMVLGFFLIIFTGYLIIYNIFQISVIRDIRYYGLLKTIGTTRRQIRNIIRHQAIYLSFVGIPIGLMIGFIVGKSFVPYIINQSSFSGTTIVVSPNPFIFFGSSLFSLFTVYISTRKPGKIAASVSPVDAVRYTEGSIKSTKRTAIKNTRAGAKMTHMAFSNLGRNRKRTVLVILSLSLSLVLLNTVFTLSKSIDMDLMLSNFVDTDFLIAHTDYFQYRFWGPENELSESFIKAVEEQPGYIEGGRLYGGSSEMFMVEDPNNPNRDNNFDEKGDFTADVYGLEELPLHRLDVIDGVVDYEKLASGRYILEGVHLDDNGVPEMNTIHYNVGDKVILHNYKGKADVAYADREYITQEFIVLGHVAIKYFTNCDRTWGEYTFYLPAEVYKPMLENPAIMSYAFNVDDSKEQDMESFLKKYTDKIEPTMNYDSKYTMMSSFEGLQNSLVVIGGALCLIIGMVGILNFINSILTSILTRRKEFAMLQSIGMTKKQLRKMLCFEGLYYCIGTAVFTILLSIGFSILIVKSLCELIWFLNYQFIILPVVIILPILFVIGFLIPLISYAATDKQSIVERLRETE